MAAFASARIYHPFLHRAFNQFISYLFLPIESTESNDKLAGLWPQTK